MTSRYTTCRLASFVRSLRPHELGSESAKAQLLLKQLAGTVAQNPPADHALGTALAVRVTVGRGRQIGVNSSGAGQTQTSNLPARIDGETR